MIDYTKVLVLAAHPDDEMACSGTIRRLVDAGARVDIVTFSDCENLIPDGFEVSDLVSEWNKAIDLIGISGRMMLDLPNREFPLHRQSILDEIDSYRDEGYELILAPATFDSHQDHAAVSAEAIRVFKRSTIFGYELPINEVRPVLLNGFVHLDAGLVRTKIAHAATYLSQADKPYMKSDYIKGLAAVRGLQAGAGAAEAFEVIRWHG